MDSRSVTSTLGLVLGAVWTALQALFRSTTALLRRVAGLVAVGADSLRDLARRARAATDAPATRTAAGVVRSGLFGRRRDLTAAILVAAPVLALASAWGVGATVGFHSLYDWSVGTWYGTAPRIWVFVAVGALAALGIASAAANSGLVPTALLVAAPVFGAGLTSYGTAFGIYDTVSLPAAAQVGAAAALVVGLPLGACAFVVGVGLRRAVGGAVDGIGTPSS